MVDCRQRGKFIGVKVTVITECQASFPELSKFSCANKVNPVSSRGGKNKLQKYRRKLSGVVEMFSNLKVVMISQM